MHFQDQTYRIEHRRGRLPSNNVGLVLGLCGRDVTNPGKFCTELCEDGLRRIVSIIRIDPEVLQGVGDEANGRHHSIGRHWLDKLLHVEALVVPGMGLVHPDSLGVGSEGLRAFKGGIVTRSEILST